MRLLHVDVNILASIAVHYSIMVFYNILKLRIRLDSPVTNEQSPADGDVSETCREVPDCDPPAHLSILVPRR